MSKMTYRKKSKSTIADNLLDLKSSEEPSDYCEGDSEEEEGEEETNPQLKKEMEALVKQLQKILKTHEAKKILPTSKPSPIAIYLNRYAQALELTHSYEHSDYFLKIYNKYRLPILSNKSDKWIRTGSIKIRFGEEEDDEVPRRKSSKKSRKICIMLSSIYNTAHKLRSQAEEKLEGMPEEEWNRCVDLIWCDTILLHLYRIFREIAPSKDHGKLEVIIKTLENDLGVVKNQATASNPLGNLGNLGDLGKIVSGLMGSISEATAAQQSASPTSNPSSSNSFSKAGGNAPPAMPDVEKIFGSLLQNDAVKGVINNMITSLNGAGSMEEALKQVTSIVTDPKLKEAIMETGIETASRAVSNSEEGDEGYGEEREADDEEEGEGNKFPGEDF
jgi:hypothetical protein